MTSPRTVLLCSVAILASSCGGDSSTGPGGGNGNNRPPNTIQLGDTLARTFKDSAQADTLTVSADRVLRLHVDVQQTAAGNGGLVSFKLVDPSTQAVVQSGGGVGFSSLLGLDINDGLLRFYFLPHAGSYLLIATRNPSYTGGYRVRMVGSDPAPEHAKARLVPGDSIVESIDGVGDVDEYYLILNKSAPHAPILFFRAETGRATDTIVVEFENGQPYAFSPPFATSPGNDARMFGATMDFGSSADSVHIRLRGSSSGAVGQYRLKWIAADDAPEGASPQLVVGDTVAASIEYPGDVDVFTFSGVVGKSYAVAVQASSGRSSERLEFKLLHGTDITYDRVLPGDTPTLLGQMSNRFDGPDQYTLRVSNVGDLVSKSSYRIAVLRIDPAPEHAPATLVVGDTVTEAMDLQADLDEFDVQAHPGDTLVVFAQAFGDTTKRPHVAAAGFSIVAPLVSPPSLVVSPRPGDPLRAFHVGPMVAGPTGPYKIRVTSDGSSTGGFYVGQYRLAAARISGAPELVPATIAAGTMVTESGDPPGDIDHFIIAGAPGQEVAIYASPTNPTMGGVGYAVWTIPFATLGQQSDSLGWLGTPLFTLGTAPITIDVQPFGTLGQAFEYRLWAYALDRRPEHASATIHIGDVVSNEVLWPAADIDEFTLAAGPNTKYQVCVMDREPAVAAGHIEMEVLANGANVGFANSFATNVVPSCVTLTTPATGATMFRILTNDFHGGAYELSVNAVP